MNTILRGARLLARWGLVALAGRACLPALAAAGLSAVAAALSGVGPTLRRRASAEAASHRSEQKFLIGTPNP